VSGIAGSDGDHRVETDRQYLLAHETAEEAADAILGSLEYLVREAHAAGLRDLARALTGVMLSPSHWPPPGRG
jgi:hypothetical protein